MYETQCKLLTFSNKRWTCVLCVGLFAFCSKQVAHPNHCLRRLASALSHGPRPPTPPASLLFPRLALSSSGPSTGPPPPPPDAVRKGEGEEAAEARAAEADAEAGKEEEHEADGGAHVNKATGEVGGPRGPEPTRYGDWERAGRCSDF